MFEAASVAPAALAGRDLLSLTDEITTLADRPSGTVGAHVVVLSAAGASVGV